MSEAFVELGDAINDQRFVEVDLALRRGQHIDRDDADSYAFLLDARNVLEPFYQRYACELVHRTDGYFFLLPLGDKVPRRLLGIPEMIVGQAAALLYLDPRTIERGGVLTRDDILSHLAAIMGTDTLVAAFNPKRKRMDERVAQETVRQRTAEALRKLAQLGFVSQLEDGQLRLRGALMRFADPVRGAGSPREALERLIARGEVAIAEEFADRDDDETQLNRESGGLLDDGVDGLDADARNRDDAESESESAESESAEGQSESAESQSESAETESSGDDATTAAGQANVGAGFSYDSEFPGETALEDEQEDDYLGHDVEHDDVGEPLGHDDAAHSEAPGEPKPPRANAATTQAAEWDPTFDDFD